MMPRAVPLAMTVDDDAEGGAAGDDCVAPHRVLDRERLFLVASAAVVGHLPNEPVNVFLRPLSKDGDFHIEEFFV